MFNDRRVYWRLLTLAIVLNRMWGGSSSARTRRDHPAVGGFISWTNVAVGITSFPWLIVMFRLNGLFRLARRSVCSAADMAKGKFFYAVRQGFKPGVYSTWWLLISHFNQTGKWLNLKQTIPINSLSPFVFGLCIGNERLSHRSQTWVHQYQVFGFIFSDTMCSSF